MSLCSPSFHHMLLRTKELIADQGRGPCGVGMPSPCLCELALGTGFPPTSREWAREGPWACLTGPRLSAGVSAPPDGKTSCPGWDPVL